MFYRACYLVLVCLLAQACNSSNSSELIPPDIQFRASRNRVQVGGKVQLQWTVLHADKVELMSSASVDSAPTEVDINGKLEAAIQKNTVFVLTARNKAHTVHATVAVHVESTDGTPFLSVMPSTILAGESTVLAWSAPGSQPFEIFANGMRLDFNPNARAGSLTHTPSFDTEYRIKTATHEAISQVRVSPRILTFSGTNSAGQISIQWKAGGASKLSLSSPGRGTLFETENVADIGSGTFSETTPASVPNSGVVFYDLRIQKGAQTVESRLEVVVQVVPKLITFDVPNFIKSAQPFNVQWKLEGADRVEIWMDGSPVYQTPNLAAVFSGTTALSITSPSAEITLVAHNLSGGVLRETKTIELVGETSLSFFKASRQSVEQGGDQITLSWWAPNARRIQIRNIAGVVLKELKGKAVEKASVVVFPNRAEKYTLIADNQSGDAVSSAPLEIDVSEKLVPAFNKDSVPAGSELKISGANHGTLRKILGLPIIQRNEKETGFVDIEGDGFAIDMGSNYNEATVFELPEPFTTYIYGQFVQSKKVSISENGWFVFLSEPVKSHFRKNPDNLPSIPLAIAPLFGDLRPGVTGKINLRIDGEGLNRRMIIQWSNFRHIAQETSLTFQVQLEAYGRIVFAYKQLDALPAEVAAGVVDKTGGLRLSIPPPFVAGETVTLFGLASVDSTFRAPTNPFHAWSVVRDGDVMDLSLEPDILPNGGLAIREVNLKPIPAGGEWFEISNESSRIFDLRGWQFKVGEQTHTVSRHLKIPAGASILVANSPAANDGLAVDYQLSTPFSFSEPTTLELRTENQTYASISWGAGDIPPAGITLLQDPPTANVVSAPGKSGVTCAAGPSTYGSQGQKGYPRKPKPRCFPYQLQGPSNSPFSPISTTGAAIPWPDEFQQLTTLKLPFKVNPFGIPTDELYVSANGFVSIFPIACSTQSDFGFDFVTECFETVEEWPGELSKDGGTIAPLWDRFGGYGGITPYWKWEDPDQIPNTGDEFVIVSWEKWTRSFLADDLNFQVQLFVNGDITFRYGPMDSQSPIPYHRGATAASWLKHINGQSAIQVNHSTATRPGIEPNSSFLFKYLPQ